MFWKNKLTSWEEAGLITHEAAGAIRTHEENRGRGRFAHNLILVGVFAIILGIISIIAANWQAIPDFMKIAGHVLLLNATSGGFLFWAVSERKGPRTADSAILLFWGLLLSLMVLIGQVYNIHSDPFRTIAIWTAIGTPLILLYGQSRFIAIAWLAALIASFVNIVEFIDGYTTPYYSAAFFLWLLPPALLIISKIKILSSKRPTFSETFQEWGVILFALIVAIAQFTWYADSDDLMDLFIRDGHSPSPLLAAFIIIFAVATALSAAGMLLRREKPGEQAPWLVWLAAGTLLTLLPLELSSAIAHLSPLNGVVSTITFIIWCLVMAWFALKIGHRWLANAAILLIIARLLGVYFEVFGNLIDTGIALLIGGGLFIAITLLANRIRKRIMPCAAKS